MVTYGGKDEFSGVNPTQSAAAQARLAQIQRENESTQQQRQQAPSNLSSSSQQFKDVKAAESQAAQQAYVSGQFQQKGTTQDQYTAARDQALKSGSFNYGGTNAFYSPPPVYLNKGGQTISRTSQDIAAPISFGSAVSSKESAPSQLATILSKSNTPPQASNIPAAQSTNPELRTAILQTFVNDPSALKYTGTDKGSYLNSLYNKGVLVKDDFTFLNQIATNYNAKVEQQNTLARQSNIKSSVKTQEDITSNLQAAQAAGVSSVNVVDAKGNVIGTVNPQNIGEARLQTLKLLTRSGGVGLSYSVSSSQSNASVESRQTTNTPSNVLTAFTGGALAGFAELGLIGLGLAAKVTGKSFTVPGTNTVIKPTGILEQAQTKVEQTFGQQTVDKLISGASIQNPLGGLRNVDLTNPIEIASLGGFAASLIATGGAAGAKALGSAPSRIAEALRAPGLAKTIVTKELQEGNALSQLSKVKGSNTLFEFEQGTAGKSAVSSTKIEDTIKVERLPSGKVQATKPITPKEVKITSPEKEVQAEIPYSVISATGKGTTSLVTKGVTNLTPQEIAIKGIPPEVAQNMGLKYVSGSGVSQVYKGKLSSKNIPSLLEEIRVGNVKPSFDVIQYFTKDIAVGGGRYGELSRNTDILSSNAFERVVRPNVLRVFESKVELEKESIPAAKGTRPMKPIGDISESLGGAGSSGKAQALTQEEKSLVQTLTKGEQATKGEASTKLEQAATTTSLTGTSQVTRGRTAQEEETIFLQTPKGAQGTRVISLGQVKTEQRQDFIDRLSELTNQKTEKGTKETSSTGLLVKTIPTSLTVPKTDTTTTTKQITVPIVTSKLITVPETTTPTPPDQTPEDKKKLPFGGGALGLGGNPGMLGKVSKGGSRKEFLGNVPTADIVGVYKRSEITYGQKSIRSAESKELVKASTGKFTQKRSGKIF